VTNGLRPEPDPRLSLEALEQKLRGLPPPDVPEALTSKLMAGIPAGKAAGPLGSALSKRWLWIGPVGILCIAASAVVYTLLADGKSKAPIASNEKSNTAGSTAGQVAPASTKAIRDFEERLRIDPYNADAWFGLAKAQADVHRSADAVESAQKAMDVARSRNRFDLATSVEAWLQSYRALQNKRAPP
jgi:hypothetical protein